MELQAFLVLCGVGVAGIAVLLLMGLFSTSGTSYEEAIAQQRKATTELLALAENKNKTKKSSKKTNKKLAKKEKSKENSAAMGSEQESEAPAESGLEDDTVPAAAPVAKGHVEFSPPVVVDVPRDTPPNVKIRKRGKDPKVKPILVNKEDPSCVNDPNTYPQPTNVVNHFEELHPKDDFELLHSTLAAEKTPEKVEEVVEKKESKPAKPAKGKPAPKAAAPVEVKEEVVRERHNSGDAAKDPKKVKKVEKKTVEEVIEPPQTEVVPPLNAPQPSELTTEKLLKQALSAAPAQPTPSPPGGKGKKKKPEPNVLSLMAGDGGGVNVGELVRVVRDAALSRTEIQILTDALLNKHHDPLPQHSEWTEGPNDPMQKLKKQLADKEKALADEIEASQALHAKLKELRANLNSERTRAAAAARASEQTGAAARAEAHTLQVRLQRLLDENHALTNEKLHLQSKLSAEAEGQAQRAQMEMHIQRLSEAESSLVSQLNALQAELSGAAVELGKARLDAGVAREALAIAQQHANELAQQLQDANRAYADLEQHAQQELRQAQERLVAMTELQNEVQRLASRAQAAEANAEKIKEDADNKIQQLSSEVASLGERLAAREAELAEIKQLKAVPAQNGLTMSAENEQQKAAELAKVESVVEALRDELASAQKSSREQREQLNRLQEQLQQHQDKNNELRTKNWKVMEALQSAEKALQTKAPSALPAQDSLREAIAKSQEAQYNEIANVLRAVCPSAAPESVVGRDWLHTFAENLKRKMHELATKETVKVVQVANTTASPPADDRVQELAAQNEQLQGLVDKYKTIIDDTEGVLSRLQQNVTTEEQRWAQQLADKQRELDELRQRTVLQEPLAFAYSCIEKSLPAIVEEMQCKIDALQAELQQAKSTGHNHSFADAERLTEERLMSGLSDKHVDTCNGPLQVGLDEK